MCSWEGERTGSAAEGFRGAFQVWPFRTVLSTDWLAGTRAGGHYSMQLGLRAALAGLLLTWAGAEIHFPRQERIVLSAFWCLL